MVVAGGWWFQGGMTAVRTPKLLLVVDDRTQVPCHVLVKCSPAEQCSCPQGPA